MATNSPEFSGDFTSDDFSRKNKRSRVSEETPDQESFHYQRVIWEGMKKRISALIKKLNPSNIRDTSTALFSNNLLRGRGLLCRSILESSVASPNSIPVLANLVAVINSKLPDIGYLLLTRILVQLKYAYGGGDRLQFVPLAKFLAELINLGVVHGNLATETVFVLLQDPSEDNVEAAVMFLLQCGYWLDRIYPCALDVAFETLGEIKILRKDWKSQCLIAGLSQIRRDRFVGFQESKQELHFVEIDEQVRHDISYLHNLDPELSVDDFSVDSQFVENEEKYAVWVGDFLEDYNVTFMPQNSLEVEQEEEGEYEDELRKESMSSCSILLSSYSGEQDSESDASVNEEEEEEIVIYD